MCDKIHNLPEFKFNRNQLPNVRLERNLIPLVIYHLLSNSYITEEELKNECIDIILTNVNIESYLNDSNQIIYVKFYLIRKARTYWNPASKLLEMQITKPIDSMDFDDSQLIDFNERVNCIDTGALIPQMSDIGFNEFAMEHR